MTTRWLFCLPLLLTACDDAGGGSPTADAAAEPDAASGGADAAPPAADAAPPEPDAAPPAADAGPTTMSAWSAADGVPEAACPAWTLINDATPEVPELQGNLLAISTDVDAERMFYHQADITVPPTLIIEARVRLVSGTSSTPSRGSAGLTFRVGPDEKKNSLNLSAGEIFLLSGENTKGPAFAMDTTDALHTYRLEVNTTTGAISVFVDGGATAALTGATFPEPVPTGTSSISWGDGTLFALGSSLWESVTHNAHAPVFCP